MYILRIVSANRQLSEAEFHQLFDNAKFKYTGGGLGDFEATVGKFTCTIDVAHPKNDRANVKTLTTLQSIIDYGKKYRGYSLRVTHADRNFGWSYTNREEGNYEFEIPSNVNPPGMIVKSKPGGRAYAVLTPSELDDVIEKQLREYAFDTSSGAYDDDEDEDGVIDCSMPNAEELFVEMIHELYWNDKTSLHRDLTKVKFDTENFDCSKVGSDDWNRFLGRNQVGDLSFYGFMAGGDWELSIFFIVYWDGKEWRGYIPDKGNTWHLQKKAAYGNEDVDWDDVDPDESAPNPDVDLMFDTIRKRFKIN